MDQFSVNTNGLSGLANTLEATCFNEYGTAHDDSHAHPESDLVATGTLWTDGFDERDLPIITLINVNCIHSPCIAIPSKLCIECDPNIYYPESTTARSLDENNLRYLFLSPRSTWKNWLYNKMLLLHEN